jgi:hypothetical protein
MALMQWQTAVVLACRMRHGDRLLQQVFAQIELDRRGDAATLPAAYTVIRSLGTVTPAATTVYIHRHTRTTPPPLARGP